MPLLPPVHGPPIPTLSPTRRHVFQRFSKPGLPAALLVLLLAISSATACRSTSPALLLDARAATETSTQPAESAASPNAHAPAQPATEQPEDQPSKDAASPTAPPEDPREAHRARFAADPFLMLDERESRGARDLVITAVGDVSQPTTQWVDLTEKLKGDTFQPTQHLIDSADLAFMNLENPMTDIQPSARKTYAFSSSPERLAWYMRAGFNMFSLANNHIADAGEDGILDTLKNIEAYAEKLGATVWYTGAGEDAASAVAPKFIRLEDKDLTVAFFSVGFSGSARVARFWDEKLPKYIADAREKADLVFVSVHAGKEYIHVPDADLQARFRKWVDAGADLVVGHHPHVVQPIEQYKNGIIFYSLGNFVFGSRTVRHRKMGARLYGLLTRIIIEDGALRGAEVVPVWVNNSEGWTLPGGETLPNANFTPKILTGGFADQFFEDFASWTAKAGATPLERVGDVGRIHVPREHDPSARPADSNAP